MLRNTHRRAIVRRGRQRRSSTDSSRQFVSFILSLAVIASLLPSSYSFGSVRLTKSPLSRSNIATANDASSVSILKATLLGDNSEECFDDSLENGDPNCATETRRGVFSRAASTWCVMTAATTGIPLQASASPQDDVQEMRTLIQEAKKQLEAVPALLAEEKWDGVRTLLMEAPLRDCWSKSTPILKKYADALGETPQGDELAALEGREELLQHLRFLDMAVYNNVFNPISTEGKTGASKALIDSYYNDPTREYQASKKAIEDLLALSN